MNIGWFTTLTEARDYFDDERFETAVWDALFSSAGIAETKLLMNAYNRLYYDPTYSLPDYATATDAELDILQKAQAEMAYYLAVHLADEDRRKGLQAQGVIQAGIVKEAYSEKSLNDLPIPPFVDVLLSNYKTARPFGAIDVARDEDESVDTKVHDF